MTSPLRPRKSKNSRAADLVVRCPRCRKPVALAFGGRTPSVSMTSRKRVLNASMFKEWIRGNEEAVAVQIVPGNEPLQPGATWDVSCPKGHTLSVTTESVLAGLRGNLKSITACYDPGD